MTEHTIETATHGRYLVERPASRPAPGMIVGFHGYSENATVQMERLQAIPEAQAWVRVSVQGLHRFYRGSSQAIAASWMTREDRDLAIRDNLGYVGAVVDAVAADWHPSAPLVFAGFSQGVGMAFRAACASARPVAAVVALAGDVPPELTADALRRVPRVFYGRGDGDPWYGADQFSADQRRVRAADVDLTTCVFDDDHVWTAAFSEAVGRFLQGLTLTSH